MDSPFKDFPNFFKQNGTSYDLANIINEYLTEQGKSLAADFNIEEVLEYGWNKYGHDERFRREISDGITRQLWLHFVKQFGLNGVNNKPFVEMKNGLQAAKVLKAGDYIINLNYDTAFDNAVLQSMKPMSYFPNPQENTVCFFKPHGSFNLAVNTTRNSFYFEAADFCGSGLTKPDSLGGVWEINGGIVPPRFNKSYKQHPIAEKIIFGLRDFKPELLIFWGVGLTASDSDLIEIYENVAASAKNIEFINPSKEDSLRADQILKKKITWFSDINKWTEGKCQKSIT